MKKLLLILLPLFLNLFLNASDTTSIHTNIRHVIVFEKGAQIHRSGHLNLSKGTHIVQIPDLPYQLNSKGLQVGAGKNVRILSIKKQQINPVAVYNDAYFRKKEEIKQLQNEIVNLQTDIQVLQLEENFILENRSFTNDKGVTQLNEIKDAAAFYRERIQSIRKEILNKNRNITAINESIAEKNKKINQIQNQGGSYSSTVYVELQCDASVSADLILSYYTELASWKPAYDFRVEDINHPISIIYKAEVYQTSGEDWNNTQLTLSSGNPNTNKQKPEFNTWYINQRQTFTYPGNQIQNKNAASISGYVRDASNQTPLPYASVVLSLNGNVIQGAVSDENGYFNMAIGNSGSYQLAVNYIGYSNYLNTIYLNNNQQLNLNINLQAQVTQLESVTMNKSRKRVNAQLDYDQAYSINESDIQMVPAQSYSATNAIISHQPSVQTINLLPNTLTKKLSEIEYKIQNKFSISSDGKANHIRIKEVKAPCEYIYYILPQVDENAFLTANISNWSELNLLSGNSTIFFDGTYIGESFLDIRSLKDTLVLSLGKEKNILIERNNNDKLSEKKVLRNGRRDNIAWILKIRNNLDSKVNLIVQEQIPVSNLSSVEIELLQSSKANVDKLKGILSWKFDLKPGEEHKIDYNYTISYPENFRINY